MTQEYVSTISKITHSHASTGDASTLAVKLKLHSGKKPNVFFLASIQNCFCFIISRDGQYIISGSEDNYVYVWKTHIDTLKMPSRRDRNEFYESFSCEFLWLFQEYN